MSPEVAKLFRALMDHSPEAREQYFADHAVDATTRREVEELLASDSTSGDRFSQLVGYAADAVLRGALVGSLCGPFRLVSVIGRGGMGVVYLAERVDGEVTQRAAVKLMQPGWSEVQLGRFLQEREILAALAHPNIAHILDAGRLPDGQPYLAMEYVEGKPIHECCEGFSLQQKVGLFLKVCKAVAYLHANSIAHRDLKPGNILVPALGEPKLLDFGIAKMLDLRGDSTVTQLRMITPDYASPEQVSGGVVGTSSDIYSLGAVLHHLLTGKPPGPMRSDGLVPELKGDMGRVLQAAMRKEPEERYATVEDFAADLQACLDSRPIRARHGNWAYRAKKFVRRHALSVALTGALASALVSVGGFAWYRFRSGSTFKDLRPNRLTANTPELPIQAAAISPDGKSIAYSDPLGIHLYDFGSGKARLLQGTSDHLLVQWMPGGSSLQVLAPNPAGAATMMVVSPSSGGLAPAPASDFFKISPDRKHRATASADGESLTVQDANGGNSRELWRAATRTLAGFEWNPDSKQIGVLSRSQGVATLETIDIAGGHKNILIPAEKKLEISSVVWPSNNRMIVAIEEKGAGVNSRGNSNLWEVRLNAAGTLRSGGLRRLTAWTDFPIRYGSLTTDGNRIVFVRSFMQRDVYVAELDPSRLRMGTPRRLTLDLGDDYPTAWTRDSKTVILTSDRNGPSAIFLQDLNKQTAEQLVAGPASQIIPRVAPDGKSILFYGRDRGKRGLMRAPVTGGTAELLFETQRLADFRCSPAGPCTIAERHDGSIVVFELDLKKGKGREIFREATRGFATPDLSPDGKWLAIVSGARVIVRSFLTGAIVREIAVRGIPNVTNLVTLDYAPDGKGFFSGDSSPTETRQLYIDPSGKASVLWRQAGSSTVWGVPSPDGRYLAMMVYTDDSNVYMVENF